MRKKEKYKKTLSKRIIQFFGLFAISIFALSNFSKPALTQSDEPITVRIGVYDNHPKIYIEDGEVKGFWVDLTEYIAEKEGWQIEYVEGTFAEGLKRLESNEIDVMVDTAVSEERRKLYDYNNENIVINWASIYSKKELDIGSMFDLEGLKVSVPENDIHFVGPSGIRNLLDSFGIEVEFVIQSGYTEIFKAVDAGKTDVGVVNRIFGANNAEDYSNIKQTGIIFNPIELRYALSKKGKNTKLLAERIDFWMNQLKEDEGSLYYRWLDKYITGALNGMQEEFSLSEDEKAWLEEHKNIRIGIDPGFAPFEFVSEDGTYTGIAADHLRLIEKLLDINFEPLPDLTWQEVIDKARKQEIDVLPAIGITEERRQFLNYTEPYVSFPRVMIAQANSAITTIEDIENLKVGVQIDSSHHGFLKESTNITPIPYNTFQEAMTAVSKGEVDVVIGNLAVASHIIQSQNLTNLKIAGRVSDESFRLAIGVRKDWPELVSILNKSLSVISANEKAAIFSKWLPALEYKEPFILTEEERYWLANRSTMRLGNDISWAPFDFVDELGAYQGICSDYASIVSRNLNIDIQSQNTYPWNEMIERVKQSEIDIIPCIVASEERSEFLLFTEPYLQLPHVLVVREDAPLFKDFSEMNGKKMAVRRGFVTEEWLSESFPGIIQVPVADFDEALMAVSSGRVDGALDTFATIKYTTQKLGLTNLRISVESPFSIGLSFGVRKDWPELLPILERLLDQISEQEKDNIEDKWTTTLVRREIDLRLAGGIAGLALFIISFVLFWNRRLRKEISLRKEAEQNLALYMKGFETSPNSMALLAYKEGNANIIHVNTSFSKFYGYSEEEVIGKNPDILSSDKYEEDYFEKMYKTLLNPKKGAWQASVVNKKKDGSLIDVLVTISTIFDTNKKPAFFVEQHIDVSKETEINRAKTEFVSLASHQLRTPLTSIKWILQAALKKKSDLNEWQEEFLSDALTSTERMIGLVTNLLNISRLEAGLLEIESKKININEFIEGIIKENKAIARKKSQSIKFIPLDPDITIFLDPQLISQVINNFISNALRYSEFDKSVKVKIDKVKNGVEISVKDNGIGISKSDQKNLFKALFRSSEASKMSPKGSGLGLYVANKIAKICYGKIKINSSSGQGSTFTLFLPAQGPTRKGVKKLAI